VSDFVDHPPKKNAQEPGDLPFRSQSEFCPGVRARDWCWRLWPCGGGGSLFIILSRDLLRNLEPLLQKKMIRHFFIRGSSFRNYALVPTKSIQTRVGFFLVTVRNFSSQLTSKLDLEGFHNIE
jgi:hypothetical protein